MEKILFPEEKDKKKNKKKEYYKRMQVKHQESLESIKKDPSTIGIYDASETPLIEKKIKKNGEWGEIDAIVFSEYIAYYIEYKCKDSYTNRNHAETQLKKAKRCLENNKNLTKLLYVHGDFKVDELTEEGFAPFNYSNF